MALPSLCKKARNEKTNGTEPKVVGE